MSRRTPILVGLVAAGAVAVLAERVRRLDHQSTHDPLTGVLNRAGLTRSWNRHRRHVTALVLLDLDGFKPINDEHGHAAGDEVLRTVAHRLTTVGALAVARLGGDEFVVLLRGDPQGRAPLVASAVAEPIQLPSGTLVEVTASLGVTPIGADLGTTMAHADRAMYRAKTGGTTVERYDPWLDSASQNGRPTQRVRDWAALDTNRQPRALPTAPNGKTR